LSAGPRAEHGASSRGRTAGVASPRARDVGIDAQDPLGVVFAALADPTRRWMVQQLLREDMTTVPALTGALPITRQAVAKHLVALEGAGLIERVQARGREVPYRLRPGALGPAAAWMRQAETAWEGRLGRLKGALEGAG
jgi:ArsR family transcriptional regulator, cadmium/lead-responsive transcriptional repressor